MSYNHLLLLVVCSKNVIFCTVSDILPLVQCTWLLATLRSPSVSIRHLKLQTTCAFWFVCKRIVVYTRYISRCIEDRIVINSESDFQGHSRSLVLVPFDRSHVITGSIARSANLAVFSLLRGRFWSFSPRRGDTLHRWGWNLAWRRGPSSCQISPPSVQRQGSRTPKIEFLLRFDRNVEYKRPAGAYPLRDFHKICRFYTSFQDALIVKICLDLLNGLWSYGGFKLRGSGFPQIFRAP